MSALSLGFARGVAPGKWARRWAESAAKTGAAPLELVPLNVSGRVDHALDVVLERVPPGERPEGIDGEEPSRRAIRLYVEAVALIVASDHELAEQETADRDSLQLLTLLAHPDHAAAWPRAEPWQDESWAPRNALQALELAATGSAGVLLSLPLARHLADKREHAILPVVGEPPLPGTEIWASWAVDRDAPDVQQLVGVLRGRTARSGRTEVNDSTGHGGRATPTETRPNSAAPKPRAHTKKQTQPPKNSRGAQLAAARAAGKSAPKGAPRKPPKSGRRPKRRGAR